LPFRTSELGVAAQDRRRRLTGPEGLRHNAVNLIMEEFMETGIVGLPAPALGNIRWIDENGYARSP
jgi:hypothetical protein